MSARPHFPTPHPFGAHSCEPRTPEPSTPEPGTPEPGTPGPSTSEPSTEARAPAPAFARRREAVAGAGLLAVLVILAALAHTASATRFDLRIDRALAPLRSAGATDVFRWLTDASAEAVGVAALVVGFAVLVARGRRLDAARLVVTTGTAWSLALVLKAVVDRPRPPASLWVQAPDNTGSFPSGHDTTATLMLVIVVCALVGTGVLRRVGAVLGVVFALAAGFGRVYLGDHYPTDILGSYLTVAATVLLVLAVTDLAPVRRALAAVGLKEGRTPVSWRGRSSETACPRPAAHATPSTENVPASVRPRGHPTGLALSTGRVDAPLDPITVADQSGAVDHPQSRAQGSGRGAPPASAPPDGAGPGPAG